MTILRSLAREFQFLFPLTKSGQERFRWFVLTLQAILVPITISRTSNLLRAIETLFGVGIAQWRYYTFMASVKLPWEAVWETLWRAIPNPLVGGRLLLALDDSINPKTGKHIFACQRTFDHAAKRNRTRWPWAQTIVTVGLLVPIHGRWSCLPLAFGFYLRRLTLRGGCLRLRRKALVFADKFAQAVALIARPDPTPGKAGRPRKYGARLGSASDLAAARRAQAQTYTLHVYGALREVVAAEQVVMLKTLRCPVRVVWVYRKTQWVALMTTDLDLTVAQIIEYYAARWKIEAGFREIKQEIGSAYTQTRNPDAVVNHLHFCMAATTITWIYAAHLEQAPARRYASENTTEFAFADARRALAKHLARAGFGIDCQDPGKSDKKPLIAAVMDLVA
jgi:hypothetical protein